MKILKHGECYTDKNRRYLVGNCDMCHCKFETFVDIINDGDRQVYIADKDCTSMKFEPEYAKNDLMPTPNSFVMSQVLVNVNFSLPCPECGLNVELRVKGGVDQK